MASYVFDADITPVFPFLHAHVTKIRKRSAPPFVRFAWQGKEWILRSSGALAGLFTSREEATEYGEKLCNLINSTYRDRAAIVPDEPERMPTKIMEVLRVLPRDNCGKCGMKTCTAFAASVCVANADPWACPSFPRPKRGRFQFQSSGGAKGTWFELDLDVSSAGAVGIPHDTRDAAAGGGGANSPDLSALTHRELQVLELMALGFSNREIADQLGISPHTIKTHGNHIFEKLDVTDRTQASVLAARCGLV